MADTPLPNPEQGAISPTERMKWAGWIGGLVFIVMVVVLGIKVPYPTGFQEWVFRVVMSIGAASFCAFVPGFLIVQALTKKEDKQAGICGGGAIVVFILLMYVNPTRLGGPAAGIFGTTPTGTSTNMPNVDPDGRMKADVLSVGPVEPRMGYGRREDDGTFTYTDLTYTLTVKLLIDNATNLSVALKDITLRGLKNQKDVITGSASPDSKDRLFAPGESRVIDLDFPLCSSAPSLLPGKLERSQERVPISINLDKILFNYTTLQEEKEISGVCEFDQKLLSFVLTHN
jgi:hypothetical protein